MIRRSQPTAGIFRVSLFTASQLLCRECCALPLDHVFRQGRRARNNPVAPQKHTICIVYREGEREDRCMDRQTDDGEIEKMQQFPACPRSKVARPLLGLEIR